MPYQFTQDGGEAVEIAGYYYVQPFSFQNSRLLRDPRSARLAVTVALTGYNDDQYPSVTESLAVAGKLVITDEAGENGNTILSARGFNATAVSSSQSRDLALTTWIFQGRDASSISFTPATINIEPNPGRVSKEDRVRWYGHADVGGEENARRLNLSYIASQISFGRAHDLTAIDLIGIANMQDSGSLVAWLLDQALNRPLGMITVSDASRGKTSIIAGDGPDADGQMANARGAAYIFNGIFKDLPAADLAAFSRHFTDQGANIIRDAAHEGSGIFADMTQRVSATPGGTQKNPAAYAAEGPDFEGLSMWALEPRGTKEEEMLLY